MANKFNIVVDFPMTEKQKAVLNRDLQAAVKKNIALIDNLAVIGSKRIPRKEWLGIWIKRFADINALKNAADFTRYR